MCLETVKEKTPENQKTGVSDFQEKPIL